MSGRGGARRTKVVGVDDTALGDFLDRWCQERGAKVALHFGPYEVVGKSQAVHPAGLHHNSELLAGILVASPTGYVTISKLKPIFAHLAGKISGLYSSKTMDVHLWAGQRADVVMCMLYHLRRCKDKSVMAALQGKATAEQLEAIKSLLEHLDPHGDSASDLDSASQASALTLLVAEQQQVELDLDDSGYPSFLSDDDEMDCKAPPPVTPVKPFPKKARLTSTSSGSKHCLEPGSPETPAAEAVPASLVAPKNKQEKKQVDKGKTSNVSKLTSKSFGVVKVGCYSRQSYVQMFSEETNTWKLLIAVSQKQSAEHDIIAKALLLYSLQPGLTKEDMVAQRNEMVYGT